MSKFQQKREQSIHNIVEVALRLFADTGYDATSIRSIATEAGISLGLLYNYFKSKEELLEEIFRRGVGDLQASFTDSDDAFSPTSGIEHHIRQTVKLLKEKKDFWRLLHSIRLQSPLVQQLMATMNGQSNSTEARIRQYLIEAGIPFPDLEAKLFFASLDGMAQHFLLYESYPIDDVATLLIMKYKR